MAVVKTIENQDIDVVLNLLQNLDYNPNEEDNTGKTPLIAAILRYYDHGQHLRKIIDCLSVHPQFDVNYKSIGPGTVRRKRRKPCIESARITDNFANNIPYSWTCLHWSVMNVKPKATNILTNRLLCDINIQDVEGITALHVASEVEDIESAKILSENSKCDVNVQDYFKETALHWACFNGFDTIVKLILNNARCKVNLKDRTKSTALHYCSENGHVEATKLLLKDFRCNINCTDDNGRGAIHLAASLNQAKILSLLLENDRCDINMRDNRSLTCLHEAASQSHAEATKVLLDSSRCLVNVQNNRTKQTPLHFALDWGESSLVFMNNLDSQDLSDDEEWMMWMAQQQQKQKKSGVNRSKTVRLFLENEQCDINLMDANGNTPLHCCISNNLANMQKELGMIMSNPTVYKSLEVTNNDNESILLSFLNTFGNTAKFEPLPIMLDYLKILLKPGKGVNTSSQTLATAVLKAASSISQLLLSHSADVNSAFDSNETAIHCAIEQDSVSKVLMLVAHGADTNIRWQGLTPIQHSIARGSNPKIITALSKNIPKDEIEGLITSFSVVGETPLNSSIRLGIEPWIEYFSRKENVHAKDKTGMSAIDLSCKSFRYLHIVSRFKTQSICRKRLEKMQAWYAFKKQSSVTITPDKRQRKEKDTNRFIAYFKQTQKRLRSKESQRIEETIFSVIEQVNNELRKIRKYSHFAFSPLLAGSTAEGTKTYMPNELDIICEFIHTNTLDLSSKFSIYLNAPSPWIEQSTEVNKKKRRYTIDPKKVSRDFYKVFRQILLRMIQRGMKFGELHFLQQSFILKDRISCLQFLWRGTIFKDMMIFVDLVPAFPFPKYQPSIRLPIAKDVDYHLIAKVSRRYTHSESMSMKVSFSRSERALILALPLEIREGLTIAKALRNRSVCQPDDVSDLRIAEDIVSEDFITSYMLKTCLFDILTEENVNDLKGKKSALDWADHILGRLETYAEKKEMLSFHDKSEILFACIHSEDEQIDACCLNVKVILILCQTMRQWIHAHRIEFENWKDDNAKVLVYSRGRSVMDNFLAGI